MEAYRKPIEINVIKMSKADEAKLKAESESKRINNIVQYNRELEIIFNNKQKQKAYFKYKYYLQKIYKKINKAASKGEFMIRYQPFWCGWFSGWNEYVTGFIQKDLQEEGFKTSIYRPVNGSVGINVRWDGGWC